MRSKKPCIPEKFAPCFDRELLAKDAKARIAAFDPVLIPHDRLNAVAARVMQQLRALSKRNIIAVIGPSGVGKTALLKVLMRRILNEYAKEMRENKTWIPAIYVELSAATGPSFDFADMLYRCLRALRDPFFNDWSDEIVQAWRRASGDDDFWTRLNIREGLRFSFESAVQYRQPLAIFLDEIHHAGKTGPHRTLNDQSRVLKSVSNQTNTTLVVAGTEEAMPLFGHEPQMSSRTRIIPYLPYSSSDIKDRKAFFNYALNLLARLPVESIEPAVFDDSYLMAISVGEAGVLKTALQEGLTHCLYGAEPRIFRRDDIEAVRQPVDQPLKLIDSADKVRTLCEMGALADVVARFAGGQDNQAEPDPIQTDRPKPGHRSPALDPVGMK